MKKILMLIITVITFLVSPKVSTVILLEEENQNKMDVLTYKQDEQVKYEKRIKENFNNEENNSNESYYVLIFLSEETVDNQGSKFTGQLVFSSRDESNGDSYKTGTYILASTTSENLEIQDRYPKSEKKE